MATTAVVPVGLTAHRERLPRLRTLTAEEARALARTLARVAGASSSRAWAPVSFGAATSSTSRPGCPSRRAAAYEGFPVVEDGIGLVRRFEDGWARARRRAPARLARPRAVTVVTGEMYAPRLARACSRASR